MEQKTKNCRDCGHYGAYYTKGASTFARQKIGKCALTGGTVSQDFGCERWKSDEGRKQRRRAAARQTLDGIFEEISAIASILKEEEGK